MTDLELIARCIDTLGKINIPVEQLGQVGVPIANVRNDLILLHNAVVSKTQAEEKAPEEEPTVTRECGCDREEAPEEPKEEA